MCVAYSYVANAQFIDTDGVMRMESYKEQKVAIGKQHGQKVAVTGSPVHLRGHEGSKGHCAL